MKIRRETVENVANRLQDQAACLIENKQQQHVPSPKVYIYILARLLILIKKGGLLQLKLGVVGVNIYCGRDNFKSFSCILPKFVMHVMNDQFSDKFNNGQKKFNYCDFSPFTSII